MARNEQQFRIAEIDVSKSSVDDRIAGIFRFEQAGSVGRGPTLLIIADIHSSLYAYERLLDVISATAEQARLMVTGVGQDPVARFEKLIQRLNEAVATFAEQEATPLNWKRVNAYIIELSDGHMCFSGIGVLMNVFYQKQSDETYRAFDIFGSLEQPVTSDPKKPFASIVCGDMKAGDILIAGTNNLERLRSELQFKERLTTLPPISAALEIRNELEKRSIPDHFAAAVIACQECKPPESEQAPLIGKEESKDKSTASIEKLRSAEDDASNRLAPVLPTVAKLRPSNLLEKAREALQALRSLTTSAVRRSPVDAVALASLRSMNAGYGNVLTKKRKLALAAGVGLVILTVTGVLWWKHAQRVAAETALWNATFDAATDQRNRAESDLIYGNDERARSELTNAEQTITGLPTDTPERKSRIERLKTDLGGLKDRLKKIVKTDTVTELTALGAATPDGALTAPVLNGDTAYVVDNATSALLKISLTSKLVKPIAIPKTMGRVVSGTATTDGAVFATSEGKLFSVKKSDDSIKTVAWTHTKSSSTVDVVLYGGKLYSLDPEKNQVWRSTGSSGSFAGDTAYIKATSVPISTAVAMAIDSSVYLLKNDGSLVRFLSGGQEGFALATIDPPLRSGSSIWTIADAERVIITDPADARVLIYDKNGSLKAQVISSQLRAPRDVTADEANKRMLIVDSNRLLLLPLP